VTILSGDVPLTAHFLLFEEVAEGESATYADINEEFAKSAKFTTKFTTK